MGDRPAHRLRVMERSALPEMKMTKKYYFVREERAAIHADDEETARLHLADLYADSESFILDDVMDVIEVEPGVFKAIGR